MKPKLTIIIPCYNCFETLEESIASCFAQGFENGELEIVMVDDGSTDNTKSLMHKLSEAHPEIKLVFHEINKGGGAARNTAVENASAEIIFCLDSDDILPDNTLPLMLETLEKKGCDGVVFEGGLSFSKNKENSKINKFGIDPERAVMLSDFFEGKQVGVTANFLYTKKAFNICGKYPINHNFDTQGFGVRFLAKKLSAFVCPGAYFYQRQFSRKISYFERSYEAGELSLNYFLIFQETFSLLNESVRKKILSFDVFGNNKLDGKDLASFVHRLYRENKEDFFAKTQSSCAICDAAKALAIGDIKQASTSYQEALKDGLGIEIINFIIQYLAKYDESEDKRIVPGKYLEKSWSAHIKGFFRKIRRGYGNLLQ